jgi:S-sulfosulfanyl-L-cysteine sulfohydrolase
MDAALRSQVADHYARGGIMEDVCDNLFNPDPYYQQGGDMVRIGGMDYSRAPAETIGGRISDLTLDSGKLLGASPVAWRAGPRSIRRRASQLRTVLAAYMRNAKEARPKKLNEVLLKGVANNPGVAR